MPRLHWGNLPLKINTRAQVQQLLDHTSIRRPWPRIILVWRRVRVRDKGGGGHEHVTGWVGRGVLRWVAKVGHAGMFEGEDEVDGDFSGVEVFYQALSWLGSIREIRVEVEWRGVEVQRLEGKVCRVSC